MAAEVEFPARSISAPVPMMRAMACSAASNRWQTQVTATVTTKIDLTLLLPLSPSDGERVWGEGLALPLRSGGSKSLKKLGDGHLKFRQLRLGRISRPAKIVLRIRPYWLPWYTSTLS